MSIHRFKNDPSQLTVRWSCNCATCGKKLAKGAQAYYWPSSKKMYCLPCGESDFRQFEASAQDEEIYNSTYY